MDARVAFRLANRSWEVRMLKLRREGATGIGEAI